MTCLTSIWYWSTLYFLITSQTNIHEKKIIQQFGHKQKLVTFLSYDKVISIHTVSVNPFPHIDAFWCLCSRWLFKNIVTKEEIAQNKQFLLLPQCFPLLVIGYAFKICSKSSAAEFCCMRKRVNTFPHTDTFWRLDLQ